MLAALASRGGARPSALRRRSSEPPSVRHLAAGRAILAPTRCRSRSRRRGRGRRRSLGRSRNRR
eukprot:8715766-Alexandrium_andersonii.AAC.1